VIDILAVGLGGGCGAILRYGVSRLPFNDAFPWATFVVNIVGAVLLGFLTGLTRERGLLPAPLQLGLTTGLCGGFTTFSTFSLEAWDHLRDERYLLAGGYVAASLVCCLAGIAVGMALAHLVIARTGPA
jgi:CrcB protein